jgi:hypothetical protein
LLVGMVKDIHQNLWHKSKRKSHHPWGCRFLFPLRFLSNYTCKDVQYK